MDQKVKKCIQKIFKEKTLDLIVECNIKIVYYLDAILKLDDGACKTYKKLNDKMKYTQRKHRSRPVNYKADPKINCNKIIFLAFIKIIFLPNHTTLRTFLATCRNKEKLMYVVKSVQNQKEPRKYKRTNTCFNPLYRKTLKTNIFFLSPNSFHEG